MKKIAFALPLLFSFLCTTAHSSDPATLQFREKIALDHGCIACHIEKAPLQDQDGNAVQAPDLTKKMSFRIRANLKAFREGSRKSAFMNPVAANLTDQEILELAAYFPSLGAGSSDGILNNDF